MIKLKKKLRELNCKEILNVVYIFILIILFAILIISISGTNKVDYSQGLRSYNEPTLLNSSYKIEMFFDANKTVKIKIDGTNYPVKKSFPTMTDILFLIYNSQIEVHGKSDKQIPDEQFPGRYFEEMVTLNSKNFFESANLHIIEFSGEYFDAALKVGAPLIKSTSVFINGEVVKSAANPKTVNFDGKYLADMVKKGEVKTLYGPMFGIILYSDLPKNEQNLSVINITGEMLIENGGPLVIERDTKWFPFDGYVFDGLFELYGKNKVDLVINYPDNFYSHDQKLEIYSGSHYPFHYERNMQSIWQDSHSSQWIGIIEDEQKMKVHISFSRFGTVFNYLFLITISVLGFLYSFREKEFSDKFIQFIEFLILTVILVFIGLGRPFVLITLQELFCVGGFLIGLIAYYYKKNEIIKAKVLVLLLLFFGIIWAKI